MYITIHDVIGKKRIDLSYQIHSTAGWGKEVSVIRMLSDNVQYQILKLRSVMGPARAAKGSHGSYFEQKKDDSKWNLCRQRVTLHCRKDG